VAEQRYKAVLAVIGDGRQVSEVASAWGVSRQTMHAWLARYEQDGLEGLVDRSHRPGSCPHQMDPVVEVGVLEARRRHPGWGPRRIVHELGRRGLTASESGVNRALRRSGLIDPAGRRGRQRDRKRWERARPNELWQMDVVGGVLLEDGTTLKCLTGVDDRSRFCVSARLPVKERTQPVCDALEPTLARCGVPEQVLTDNGKVFTGRFNHPPTEVLLDRICRVNGIEHLLTKPRSPTTTGKIERFHRSLRAEFLTGAVFPTLEVAQDRLDASVASYNTDRPHQGLEMATPAERFTVPHPREPSREPDRSGPIRAGPGRHEGVYRWGRVRALATGVRRAAPSRRKLRRASRARPAAALDRQRAAAHRAPRQHRPGPQQTTRGRCPDQGPEEPGKLNVESVKDQPT